MRQRIILCALLAGFTLLTYWPVRNNDFVAFDDPQFVLENKIVQQGINIPNVRWAFTTPLVANWHPVTTLSHMLDCALFGLNPAAHHLMSVFIHALNSALLFLVLLRLMRADHEDFRPSKLKSQLLPWPCFFIAALFAVHPLHVESVAWVSERKDVLSGFFFMLTLLTYGGYVTQRSTRRTIGLSDNRTIATQRAIGLSDNRTIGLGHKKSKGPSDDKSSTLEVRPSPSCPPRSHSPMVPWSYCLALSFFALGLMSKPMLVTVPFVLLLLDFWPFQRWTFRDFSNAKCLLIEKVPFFLLAIVFSVITYSIQQQSAMAMNEAMTGWNKLGNAAVGYCRYLGKFVLPQDLSVLYPLPEALGKDGRPTWQVAGSLFILALISAAVIRRRRSEPYAFTGWFWFLGMLVPVIGIVQVGEQAIADRYTYLPSIGLGLAIIMGLETLFNRMSLPRSLLLVLLSCWIVALTFSTRKQLQHWQNTISLFSHAMQVNPENPSAHFALATGLERAGRSEEAVLQYEAVLAAWPMRQDARYNLAQLLRKLGRFAQAAQHYEVLLDLSPGRLDAKLNLANCLSSLGRDGEAIRNYRDVLTADPKSVEALNNLAWVLATDPQPGPEKALEAISLAEKAAELSNFQEPTIVGTLAAAYASAGRFVVAETTASKAIQLALAQGNAQLVEKNTQLLERYRARKTAAE